MSMKKIDFKRGSGEYVAFAVLAPMICLIVVYLCAFIQMSNAVKDIDDALQVIGRSAAVCTTEDGAKKQMELVLSTALTNENVKNPVIESRYIAEDMAWEAGAIIVITLKADLETITPYFMPRTIEKSIVITLETYPANENDIKMMAAIMAQEAYWDEASQRAVATSIILFVEDPLWPENTIYDCITANGRYESYNTARYIRYMSGIEQIPELSLKIAREVINGKRTEYLVENHCAGMYTDKDAEKIGLKAAHPEGITIGGNFFFDWKRDLR